MWAYVGIVVAYLALLFVVTAVMTRGIDTQYATATNVDQLWRSLTVPLGAALLFVLAVVAALRWWRPVLRDDRPVQRWVIIVPVIQLAAILLAVNYGGLADRGLAFTLLLLLTALLVGFGEEIMFRGLGVTVFRANGFTEGKVALWSTVIFGLAHSTNLFTSEGTGAIIQVFIAALSGYFFYLVRRRSGGILVPAIVHGLWDFALISGTTVPGEHYPGFVASILALVVLTVILLLRRHRVELVDENAKGPSVTGPRNS
ncbi:hypothetical protein [Alloactinosynnema sp. L-07]|nr:hypothetical protein [Alloactinosynnema sp. L-07]